MKYSFAFLLFSLGFYCGAQSADSLEVSHPRIIVMTGLGIDGSSEPYKMFCASVERPAGPYLYFGLIGCYYFEDDFDEQGSTEFSGGYNIGGYAKYFLHGRFSGRKSGVYVGPELRFGQRRFTSFGYANLPFPFPPEIVESPYQEQTTKILVRWGLQWQFGHTCLDLAVPLGLEVYKTSGYFYGRQTHLVIAPSFQLGIAF